jgi:thioredoxin 1
MLQDDYKLYYIILTDTLLTIILFFILHSWCGPCKMIAPLYAELSEEYDNVIFVKVDVDENPDTAAAYSVSAMPTFVFVKGGEVVDRLMGANPTALQEMIEEHK